MIKVFFLICEPSVAWEKIAQARRGIAFISIIHILPFLLVGTALESWGLHQHGKWQPRFDRYTNFSVPEIINFQIIQFVLMFSVVFVSAFLIYNIARTFQDRLSFRQAFTTTAYGFSPLFLTHFLDVGATVHPAVPWLLGIIGVMWILYQGVPRVMQPDPTHAFGVYLSAMIVVILTSGLARAVTGMYLLGYMDLHHSWLSRKVTQLLGH